ncbi:MAG: 2'-5' RNA ligase family protein [Bacteroidetes bacterium]|nr:2'-5' RNA ligase family protein [Bacteroidota bacterium]
MLQKYFIAIVPPEPLLSDIQNIKQSISDNYQSKGALRSPGHITLHMPFSFDESKENKLIECLSDFKFKTQFPISLNNYDCFEPRVIFINVLEQAELFNLQKQLVSHVKRHLNIFNQSDDMRGFHPHITIAFRDLKKPTFYKAWEEYKSKTFSADFICNSFSLLKHQNEEWVVLKEFNNLLS